MSDVYISNHQAARRCYDSGLNLFDAVQFINEHCESSGYIKPDLINDYIKEESK